LHMPQMSSGGSFMNCVSLFVCFPSVTTDCGCISTAR
jgi:hypothetical protein